MRKGSYSPTLFSSCFLAQNGNREKGGGGGGGGAGDGGGGSPEARSVRRPVHSTARDDDARLGPPVVLSFGGGGVPLADGLEA